MASAGVALAVTSCVVDIAPLGQAEADAGAEANADAAKDIATDVPADIVSEADGPRCAAGTADCDGNASNGCETNTDANSEHCGVCFHDCLGGACLQGQCHPTLVSSSTANPHRLALSATDGTGDLYWTSAYTVGASIWRATNDLSEVRPLVSEGGDDKTAILAVALGHLEIFWSERRIGGIHGASLDGSGFRVLIEDSPGLTISPWTHSTCIGRTRTRTRSRESRSKQTTRLLLMCGLPSSKSPVL